MRLLLDQNVPAELADELREAGYDTLHTRELGLATATDAELLERAREDGRQVVTFDSDFAQRIALSGLSSPSVVQLRTLPRTGQTWPPSSCASSTR